MHAPPGPTAIDTFNCTHKTGATTGKHDVCGTTHGYTGRPHKCCHTSRSFTKHTAGCSSMQHTQSGVIICHHQSSSSSSSASWSTASSDDASAMWPLLRLPAKRKLFLLPLPCCMWFEGTELAARDIAPARAILAAAATSASVGSSGAPCVDPDADPDSTRASCTSCNPKGLAPRGPALDPAAADPAAPVTTGATPARAAASPAQAAASSGLDGTWVVDADVAALGFDPAPELRCGG